MKPKVSALLIHHQPDPWRALRIALESLGVETRVAPSCAEALGHLWAEECPHIVFTDPKLPDGSWEFVVELVRKAETPANVIVVTSLVDIHFYLAAVEGGAFDLITPPFEPIVLSHVVDCAAGDVFRRRNASSSRPVRRADDRKHAVSLGERSL
jgi:DNA-binding NtrC family response regulator